MEEWTSSGANSRGVGTALSSDSASAKHVASGVCLSGGGLTHSRAKVVLHTSDDW